jgi:hypothetical protein
MKKLFTLLISPLFLMLFASGTEAKETLYVNEILASNNTGITDETGAREDWFEIYNPNNYAVDIAGYYVTDNSSNHIKHQIPSGNAQTIIPAHGYLRLWASSATSRGVLHTSFSLSASGEYVGIYSPTQEFIDEKTFGAQQPDVSFGRNPDGGPDWSYYTTSTPAASNLNGVVRLTQLVAPTFSHTAGFQAAAFQLTITHPEPGVTIRYTTDGSDPTSTDVPVIWQYKNSYNENGTDIQQQTAKGVGDGLSNEQYASKLYSPLSIIDRTVENNRVSLKTSSIAFAANYLPTYKVYKGTTIRARVFKEGYTASEIITKTYFVNPGGFKYPVPVISITSNEKSFFEYVNGLYTPGKAFDEYRATHLTEGTWICSKGNFSNDGEDWERTGHVEFFDNSNILNQPIAFRIHGGCSRSLPEKTLRLYSDTEFNFPVFPEKPTLFPKRLLLRNSGNDNNSTMFRDAFYQTLVRRLPFDTQLSRPSILFLNSEYWGIHNITERYDRFYLEKKYNVDRNFVDLISIEDSEVEEGDIEKFNELNNFINTTPLTNTASYNMLKTMIDVENFTDYEIAEIFCGNVDWPGKNVRMWRNKLPNLATDAPYGHDGRWRWMLYDTDLSLGYATSVDHNFFSAATASSGGPIAKILSRLLENNDYKKYFLTRLADILNTTLLPSRAVGVLNAMKAQYTPIMPDHIARWKSPASMTEWNNNVTAIQNFVNQRPATYRTHVRSFFGSGYADNNLVIQVSDASLGYVKVNTIDILPTTDGISTNPYPWTGIYFQNIPVKLLAVAKANCHFVKWTDASGNTIDTPEINFIMSGSTNYRAIFEADPLPVVLKSFDAKKQDNKVVINWETTSETNNDYFVVERSENARTWTPLATVKGSATTLALQQYKTTDEQPLPGINYYRLKQVDFDQTTTYSRMASVDMGEFKITGLWPNPVSDILNLKLDQSFEQGDYEITDVNGKVIRKRQKLSTVNPARIPVESLPVGIYILKIKTRDGVSQSGKFVKE